jgi:Ankyrin repeats (3 copies)
MIEEPLLQEAAIWTVFQCHLLGIGTNPNPEIALDVLYYAGLPEYGRYWKSWVVTARLYRALGIKVPESRFVTVAAMTVNAQRASEFYQIVLSGAEPYDHKFETFHGIKLTREQFRQTSAGTPDHDTNQHASGTPTLDDIEVGGGNTLLHASALYDDVKMASYLIRRGLVDVNARNDLGETALLIACKYNSYYVLDLLLANGADASMRKWPLLVNLYSSTIGAGYSEETLCERGKSNVGSYQPRRDGEH